jgi:hypothetical protein
MNEELKYGELFHIAGIMPNMGIIERNDFYPRIIPSQYVPKIHHFSRQNYSLLYCLCLDQKLSFQGKDFSKKYYFSPSATLLATFMREDEEGIKECLGINDSLPLAEKNKINEIIHYLKIANKLDYLNEKRINGQLNKSQKAKLSKVNYLANKGVSLLIEDLSDVSVYFSGHAFSAKIKSKSKKEEYYTVTGKQFITFENNDIVIPPFLQTQCTCGLALTPSMKYEHEETVLFGDTHMELARQALMYPELFSGRREYYNKPNGNRIDRLESILSVFSPLDKPQENSDFLRKILRKGFYPYIKSQKFIQENLSDTKKKHKKIGDTFFRNEFDAYLLSFKECFNPELLQLWINSISQEKSIIMTSQFFGNYEESGFSIDKRITQRLNPVKGDVEHLLNNEWIKAHHYVHRNGAFAELEDYKIRHTKNLEHTILGKPANETIYHGFKNYKPVMSQSSQFKVGELNDSLSIYIAPYKLKKF